MKVGVLRWKENIPEVLLRDEPVRTFPGETIDSLFEKQPLLSQDILLIPEDRLLDAFVFLEKKTLEELSKGQNTVPEGMP